MISIDVMAQWVAKGYKANKRIFELFHIIAVMVLDATVDVNIVVYYDF